MDCRGWVAMDGGMVGLVSVGGVCWLQVWFGLTVGNSGKEQQRMGREFN